jgi:RNA polymerase sigma-70 factor (ECF subfamily)
MVQLPEDRFVALIAQHRGILYRVASGYGRSPDDRRDLTQEIVLQLWRSFPRYDEQLRFSTWMYRVALNVAVSFHRGERRRTGETIALEDLGFELTVADTVSDAVSDDARLLRTLIHELEPVDRALVLLYVDGCGHEETAAIVGLSVTAVSTRIHRLKDRLQKQFDERHRHEEKSR